MQDIYDGYFFIADYHSLTTHPHPEDLSSNVRQTIIEYLACGLDPAKCTLYRQSDVPQIPELYLIFNMLAYMGELERATTFKDKVRSQPDNVNAGLLTYPVLMAVDIIVHKAVKVPVGKDQQQHLEMTRTYVNRFNHMYNTEYFPEPIAVSMGDKLVNVPSLDGEGKMSKSKGEATCIYLEDAPDVVRKKIMRAVSDSGPTEPNSPKTQSVENLFDLMKLVSTPDIIQHYEDTFNNCTIRFGDMKKQIGEDMVNFLNPIRERITELKADSGMLNKILEEGGEKARISAAKTLADVRDIIGFKKFR